jgi:type II secretory pathway predicted ATPase ExeA
LLRLAVAGFGVPDAGSSNKATLLRRFEHLASDQRAAGQRCLLVVDEAQNLAITALEELRMLSNIAVDGHALVQTILLGQPQFRTALANPYLEQLRQRVLASYHLEPLTHAETRAYIEHRLRRVGWTDDPAWEEAAFAHVFQHTDGVPRRINTLCSRVLLYGSIEEVHTITGPMVEATANELAHDLGAGLSPTPAIADITIDPTIAASSNDALVRRIEAAEASIARQDRTFRRLMDLLSVMADR